jgi:hypothetical protein
MSRVPTSWLEEAILQLLREKEGLTKDEKIKPDKKQELLAAIDFELNSILNLYSEQTGKTLNEFLAERKEERTKERDKAKFYYM